VSTNVLARVAIIIYDCGRN